ncbi:BldC family transcriptional regulator [Nocardiopsis aegyptia]|uniref:BldC family transcriptional regulator n=1 Tax=Nocardiopsis aegyptia TaxID=220378 RepID=UPI00366C0854
MPSNPEFSAYHGATVEDEDDLLTSPEVAALFRVDVKTVSRWAVQGRLPSFRTPGGHRRFPSGEVHALLARSHTPIRG